MSVPRWLNETEQRAWLAFITAGGLLNRRLDQQLENDAGLSHLQYAILVQLAGAPEHELRMSELATTLLNSKSKLTYQIDRLEHAGLVRRRSCPSDMRAVYAVLTEAGRRKLEQAAPGHVATVRELFIDVLTPEQLGTLGDGLSEIVRRLRDER
ncbi:MarR family winged helix-turn-helix transcriptional regulator [Nocardia pseudobrasiliensis]|uniref:DNA-binding MarR family transcriptional regulator n=1 Tax=Nocardia pseudobrasiliensis TaxID=45979 RepID=A0A370I716_9NOCA|nr:MarR family transcriptional regulator [Nocardia pseudobrasiliensis]RDI66509.1 DNA-binding MarR family transcriptional regulator [Nocardia pseudobrasiliensis]